MHFSSSKLPFQIYWGSFIVCKKAKKNVTKEFLKSHVIKKHDALKTFSVVDVKIIEITREIVAV